MSNKRRYLGNYNAMYDAEADRCYPISKLPDWFKHDTWTNHQALCLFSNIEPSDSEIIWPDTFLERKIEVPEAQRVALLNEDQYSVSYPTLTLKDMQLRKQCNSLKFDVSKDLLQHQNFTWSNLVIE